MREAPGVRKRGSAESAKRVVAAGVTHGPGAASRPETARCKGTVPDIMGSPSFDAGVMKALERELLTPVLGASPSPSRHGSSEDLAQAPPP